MSDVGELSNAILLQLLTDFTGRHLTLDALTYDDGYKGVGLSELKKHLIGDDASGVDFDLALKDLEEANLVSTGPLEPFKNDPYSTVLVVGLFSRREYVCLTEKGYKAAQKARSKAPSRHHSRASTNWHLNMPTMNVDKILFVSADPENAEPLRIQKEFRRIESELLSSPGRQNFSFSVCLATRPADLSRAMLNRPRPRVLHFSGHGSTRGAICLQDDAGLTHAIPASAIADLLEPIASGLEVVVLNACYSREQADSILKQVPFVVGMTDSISDQAAIAYAVGFYQALFNSETVPTAHRLGCAQIHMVSPNEKAIPVLLVRHDPNREDCLEPPSVGSSFEPFLSSGPGDNADWALVFRILNSGQQDLTIRRAVYFLDSEKRVPLLLDAKPSQVHRGGYEVKFGKQWKLLECRLKPGEEALSYVPLRNEVSAFELPQGVRGELLLEYEVDGRAGRHRAVL